MNQPRKDANQMRLRNQFSSAPMLVTLCLLSATSLGCIAQSPTKSQGSDSKNAPSVPTSGSDTKVNDATADAHPALMNPSLATKQAPEKFQAKFVTTKGDFVIEVTRAWSPNGADRFYNMVDIGYFNDIAIFRAVPNFMFQFGVHGDPGVSKQWKDATLMDDPPAGVSNAPGFVTFAKTGMPNSRSAQMFVNLGNNSFLDPQGFTPFGKIVKGLDVVGKINTEYGENAPEDQPSFVAKGNAWLLKKYPRLDIIKSAEIIEMK